MPTKKSPQTSFLKKGSHNYGGELSKKRKYRKMGRPLSTKYSMHFVLRSTQAKGRWSFLNHKGKIAGILKKFADKNGVQIKSLANVGNHLHLHLQITNRQTYPRFIRAVTSAIMMAVTGASRWRKPPAKKFWDLRPFSRIVVGFRAMLTLKDYIAINQLEALGVSRKQSRFYLAMNHGQFSSA